jgi:hypothetical protein
MGVVNDAVQYRITEGGIGSDVVPLRHGNLACDQERSFVVAVIDDLEEIAALLGGKRLRSPIVDDESGHRFARLRVEARHYRAIRLGRCAAQYHRPSSPVRKDTPWPKAPQAPHSTQKCEKVLSAGCPMM